MHTVELKFGAALDYVPKFDVSGSSSSFAFDYDFETEDSIRARVLVGIQLQF